MSSSVLARKRRANGVVEKPVQQDNTNNTGVNSSVPKRGMQLTQILGVIDSRLKVLENKKVDAPVNETQQKFVSHDMVQEYEARFQMLATEINDIKDILLKLQSFTMEVNKTLFEERSKISPETDIEHQDEKSTFDSLMETIQETETESLKETTNEEEEKEEKEEEEEEEEGVNFT
jgi:hypothetical protein